MKTVSIEEGLSQSTVYTIFQDHLGIIWMGTQDGLNRYDGYDITIFRPDPLDSTTIAGNTLSAIEEDLEGRIWLALESNGLNRYTRSTGTFEHFFHEPADSTSLGSNQVFALLVDSKGTLWAGTAGSGLNRYLGDDKGFSKYSIQDPNSQGESWIYDLLELSDGSILIATDGAGLYRLNPETDELYRIEIVDSASQESLDDVVFDMVMDLEGWLWLATPRGLVAYQLQSKEIRRFLHREGDESSIRSDIVYAVDIDQQNRIWTGSDRNDLSILNESRTEFTQFSSDDLESGVIPDDDFYSMMFDQGGNLWIGTGSNGALLISRSQNVFGVFLKNDDISTGLKGRDVWSVLLDRSGDVWIGTADGGVNRVSGATGKVTQLPVSGSDGASIPDATATALFEDSKGRLWMGLDGFGVVLSDTSKTHFTRLEEIHEDSSDLSNELPHTFFEDDQGRMWMGTANGGLNVFQEKEQRFKRFVVHPDSFSLWNEVQSIAQSPSGLLWLGTLNGVVSFDPETGDTEHFPASPANPKGLSNSVVYSIHISGEDEMWLGTDGGLNKMYRQSSVNGAEPEWQFQRFGVADGLPNDVIYAVLPGKRGLLWLSTNRGLAAFDTKTHTVRSFDPGDGISGYEFNQGAWSLSENGILLFGGIGGVTVVNTAAFVESTYEPPVVLTEFRSFDQLLDADVENGRMIELSHNQNFLTLSFAAIQYRNPEKVRYRYYLEGTEEGWQEADERRYVSYAHLAPGTYVFHVQSTNGDGLWSASSTAVHITIKPPFWGTWWFRLSFLSFLILSGFTGAWLWRRAGMIKQHRQHLDRIDIQRRISDRLEAERVHLARELHDGPIQSLQLSGFQLTQLSSVEEAHEQTEGLDSLRTAISAVISDLRNICGRLRPPALVHFGLGRAIQSYSERFLEKYPEIDLHLNLPRGRTRLGERARLGLFRICQEALSNVAKHAGPCHVTITLREETERVFLEIKDDGIGFVLPPAWESLAQAQHFGLLGASERADALSGTLNVYSTPGAGTTLNVHVPIRQKKQSIPEKVHEGII